MQHGRPSSPTSTRRELRADAHLCHSGCAHAQLARVLSTGTLGVDHVATPAGHDVAHAGTIDARKPAGFPRDYGKTTWDYGGFGYPELKIEATKQGKMWEAKIQGTSSKDNPNVDGIATPEGVYDLPETEQLPGPDGKKHTLKVRYAVSAANAAQIRAAEQEHINDVSRAYEITLKAAETAVNAKASVTFTAPTKAAAIAKAKKAVAEALPKKLGANPKTWKAMLVKCAKMTNQFRDNRPNDTHTFTAEAAANDQDFDKKRITYRVKHNTRLGKPSAAIIKL